MEEKFKRKYLLRLLTSPATLLPILGGATLMAGCAFYSLIEKAVSPFMWFIGVGGVLVGSGIFLQRFLLKNDKIAKSVIEEIRAEEQQARDDILNELERQLANDEDRTTSLLRDLRAVMKSFDAEKLEKQGINNFSAEEICTSAQQHFETSVSCLRETLELEGQAEQVSNFKAKRGILARKEKLIVAVQQGLENLSKTLSDLQTLSQSDETPEEKLSATGKELRNNLDVLKRVQDRMHNISGDGEKERT